MKKMALSSTSKTLLSQVEIALPGIGLGELQKVSNEVERSVVIKWLSQSPTCDKKDRFLLESLRAALLADLKDALVPDNEEKSSKESVPWYRKGLFYWIVGSGTLLAICDGFDGMASMLSLFQAVSSAALIGAGLIFSALSVAVFYGFDLECISSELGLSLKSSRKLLDVLLEQTAEIKKIRKYINNNTHKALSLESLNELKAMLAMLEHRYKAMGDIRETYYQALKNPRLKILKKAFAILNGTLFFSGGFFTGQAMALAIGGLLVGSLSVAAPAVVAFSVLTGLAALSLYWFLERPGIENLVGRWFGLDQEKVDTLANPCEVAKQQKKLSILNEAIASQEALVNPSSEKVVEKHEILSLPCEARHQCFEPSPKGEARHQWRFFSHEAMYPQGMPTRSLSDADLHLDKVSHFS